MAEVAADLRCSGSSNNGTAGSMHKNEHKTIRFVEQEVRQLLELGPSSKLHQGNVAAHTHVRLTSRLCAADWDILCRVSPCHAASTAQLGWYFSSESQHSIYR